MGNIAVKLDLPFHVEQRFTDLSAILPTPAS